MVLHQFRLTGALRNCFKTAHDRGGFGIVFLLRNGYGSERTAAATSKADPNRLDAILSKTGKSRAESSTICTLKTAYREQRISLYLISLQTKKGSLSTQNRAAWSLKLVKLLRAHGGYLGASSR